MAATASDGDFYHRKLDRSPEKEEFFRLPKQDKQLICGLRSAMENSRSKFDIMRDELEDKDRDLSREQALRKAAETRLDQMVDMYSSPDVNQELRERLPRAGKADPKSRRLKHDPDGGLVEEEDIMAERSAQAASENSHTRSRKPRRALLDQIESQIIPADPEDGVAKLCSPPDRRSRSASAGRSSDRKKAQTLHDSDSYTSDDDTTEHAHNDRHHKRRSHSAQNGMYAPASYPSPPYPGYVAPMYNPYPGMSPIMYGQPQVPPMMPMVPGMAPQVVPVAHSTPVSYQLPNQSQNIQYVPVQGQQGSPQGQNISPQMQYASPQGQYVSPQGQYVSPQGQYVSPQGQYVPQGQFANAQGSALPTRGQIVGGLGSVTGNQVSEYVTPSQSAPVNMLQSVNGQGVPIHNNVQQAPPGALSGNQINSPNMRATDHMTSAGMAPQILSSQTSYIPNNLSSKANTALPGQLLSTPGQNVSSALLNPDSASLGTDPQYSRSRRYSDPLLQFADPSLPLGVAGSASSALRPGISTPNLLGVSGSKDGNLICREHNRQISLLLAELNAAKDMNKKLSERLSDTERELESLRLSERTREAATEAAVAGKAAALVEEIYRAQKQRDGAIMGRLRLANEERDEALSRLKRSEKERDQLESGADQELSDPSVSGLLSHLNTTDSPKRIEKQAGVIVDRIQQLRDRKKQITMEEMRAVLEERDMLLAKCKKVEQELLRLRRHGDQKVDNRQTEQLLQAKLLATQQERDMALARNRKLEEEIQTLQIYYSLHKSLSQEANLRDQYNNSLENFDIQLKQRDNMVDLAQKENNQLLAQLKSAVAEKSFLQQELSKSSQQLAHNNTCANCEKMERLVNVLRRKINGLGSKVDE